MRIWPLELQEMPNRHRGIAGGGDLLSENEFRPHGNIIVYRDDRRMMATMGVDIASDSETDRSFTGGGGRRHLPIWRLGRVACRECEDLICEPIGPQGGNLEADSGKKVVARCTTGAGSVAPEGLG